MWIEQPRFPRCATARLTRGAIRGLWAQLLWCELYAIKDEQIIIKTMPLLVLWSLLAPRRRHCFSAMPFADVVWVIWYGGFTKKKKNIYLSWHFGAATHPGVWGDTHRRRATFERYSVFVGGVRLGVRGVVLVVCVCVGVGGVVLCRCVCVCVCNLLIFLPFLAPGSISFPWWQPTACICISYQTPPGIVLSQNKARQFQTPIVKI